MLSWIVYVPSSILFIAQCYGITDEELSEIFYPDSIQTEFVTKCFGDLGCFYTGPPFYDPSQGRISVPPDDNTNAKIYLYTPDNPNVSYELVPTQDSLEKSRFNANYPLKVLIHGGGQEGFSIYFQMKDELLKEGNYNVIIVDWTKFDHGTMWQATANGRLVAAIVAKLLNFLMKETRLEPRDIHIIAHSLGAHLAGWVGKRIKNLGQISDICKFLEMDRRYDTYEQHDLLDLIDLERIERRSRLIHEHRINDLDELDDTDFCRRYRLNKSTVEDLVQRIGRNLKSKTNKNRALSPIEKVLTALRFFATGSQQINIGDLSKISQSSANRAINEVAKCLAQLRPHYIYLPRDETERREVCIRICSI